jgi:hypothetical protein
VCPDPAHRCPHTPLTPLSSTLLQVLYSTFVSMLDEGRVKAARLESGTSKLYFDLKLEEEASSTAAAAASVAVAAAAVATPAPIMAIKRGRGAPEPAPAPVAAASSVVLGQDAAAAMLASAEASSVAVPASTAKPVHRMQKQFFIKVRPFVRACARESHACMHACMQVHVYAHTTPLTLRLSRPMHALMQLADKNDLLLIHKVVAAGVEFAVVKVSVQGALYNVLLSALALWLPLMPLIFLVRRLLEDRASSAR